MLNLSVTDLRALSRAADRARGGGSCECNRGGPISAPGGEEIAQGEVETEDSALVEARNRVQQSGQEKRVIEQYVEPYRQLERAGIVGEEQRISWIDALRAANQEADLYGVEYDIGPQQPYAFTSEVNAGALSVRQSIMKLRLGLLHEGDLFRFFQALAAQKAGGFRSIHAV